MGKIIRAEEINQATPKTLTMLQPLWGFAKTFLYLRREARQTRDRKKTRPPASVGICDQKIEMSVVGADNQPGLLVHAPSQPYGLLSQRYARLLE